MNSIVNYIYSRIKDNQFEDIDWNDVSTDELKIEESLNLTKEQTKEWLFLVVNYCRHVWGFLSNIGGSINDSHHMDILSNFIEHRGNVPSCVKNKLLRQILNSLPKDDPHGTISIHISRKRAAELKEAGEEDRRFQWSVFSKVSDQLRKANFKGMRQNS